MGSSRRGKCPARLTPPFAPLLSRYSPAFSFLVKNDNGFASAKKAATLALNSSSSLIPQDAQQAISLKPVDQASVRPSAMSFEHQRADFSEGEDEELMFAFEEQDAELSPRLRSDGSPIFYSIDGVDFERPVNPMVAVLDSKKRERGEDDEAEDADLKEEKPVVTPVLSGNRKRKTFELPNAPARVIRPVAKRFKSNAYERSITAPACMMRNLSLHRSRDQQGDNVIPELENETDMDNAPFRSASINIPDSFHPIQWPGDTVVSRSSGRDRSHSCSSSSSSMSWASGLGLFCRRSLDVSSPLPMRFNDLVLHSSAGSYTGS